MTEEKPNYVNYPENPAKDGVCYKKMSEKISEKFEKYKEKIWRANISNA